MDAQRLSPVNPLVLQAFSRAIGREAHVLSRRPDLLWQQIQNRLQWEDEEIKKDILNKTSRPWIRLRTPHRESTALVRTLIGHTRGVNDCAFSPDGQIIVSASNDGTLRLWDAASGETVLTLRGHTGGVNSCVFSPDGHLLLSACEDKMCIWETITGQLIRVLEGHKSRVNACGFSPDGSYVVSVSRGGGIGNWENTLRIWYLDSGYSMGMEGHTDWVNDCALSPDGRFVVTGSEDKSLRVWCFSNSALETQISHPDSVTACTYSPDGRIVVSASRDGKLRVWESMNHQLVNTMEGHTRSVNAIVFSPDGHLLASAGQDRTVRVWNPNTGQALCTLVGHTDDVNACVFSPDGRSILSASEDETMRVWAVEANWSEVTQESHEDRVNTCVYSPDGQFVVTGSTDGTLRVWDVTRGAVLHVMEGLETAIRGCCFSPDGNRIASAGDDGMIGVWMTETGQLIRILLCPTEFMTERNWKTRCAFSQDGHYLVSSHLENKTVWDINRGAELYTLKDDKDESHACVFSPNGRLLASAWMDKTVRVWDIASGRVLHVLGGQNEIMTNCVFSPDGRFILSSGGELEGGIIENGQLKVWDICTGEVCRTLKGHTGQARTFTSCIFSPDGNLIVSTSIDATQMVWEYESGKLLGTFEAHVYKDPILFSPDGHFILSVGAHIITIRNAITSEIVAELALPGFLTSLGIHPFTSQIVTGDEGGAVYFADIIGVEYGSIIVTPIEQQQESKVLCPACRRSIQINSNQLGAELTCPTEGCGLLLKINSFVIHMA